MATVIDAVISMRIDMRAAVNRRGHRRPIEAGDERLEVDGVRVEDAVDQTLQIVDGGGAPFTAMIVVVQRDVVLGAASVVLEGRSR